jgi:hypothetical protein
MLSNRPAGPIILGVVSITGQMITHSFDLGARKMTLKTLT